jgi:hypothetical protein
MEYRVGCRPVLMLDRRQPSSRGPKARRFYGVPLNDMVGCLPSSPLMIERLEAAGDPGPRGRLFMRSPNRNYQAPCMKLAHRPGEGLELRPMPATNRSMGRP